MPHYEYRCENCEYEEEIFHSMSCEDEFICPKCGMKLEKQFSSTFHVAMGMKPTLADLKEEEHRKVVKDPERARKRRIKAFGSSEVENVRDKPDPKHVIRKGRTLGGQQMEVNRADMIKALSKDKMAVEIAKKVVKKQGKK